MAEHSMLRDDHNSIAPSLPAEVEHAPEDVGHTDRIVEYGSHTEESQHDLEMEDITSRFARIYADTLESDQNIECHLFRLPPELRLFIYDEILSSVKFIQKGEFISLAAPPPPLLDTCRFLRQDFAPVYCHHISMLSVDKLVSATEKLEQTRRDMQDLSWIPHTQRRGDWDFVLHDEAIRLGEEFVKFNKPIRRELRKLKERLGREVRSKDAQAKFTAAKERFAKICFESVNERGWLVGKR